MAGYPSEIAIFGAWDSGDSHVEVLHIVWDTYCRLTEAS